MSRNLTLMAMPLLILYSVVAAAVAQSIRYEKTRKRTLRENAYQGMGDQSAQGIQSPHISSLIGDNGEQVTPKLAAQYADAGNMGNDPATVKQRVVVLNQHCGRTERPYESIHLLPRVSGRRNEVALLFASNISKRRRREEVNSKVLVRLR